MVISIIISTINLEFVGFYANKFKGTRGYKRR